jgi:hypothetical protein
MVCQIDFKGKRGEFLGAFGIEYYMRLNKEEADLISLKPLHLEEEKKKKIPF